MKGALSDIKVLDFSTLLPGPMATLFLAEAGADVIKIERPDRGDDMRHYEPLWGESGINFAMLNRGKKSIAIDLKQASERDRLWPLIRETDVLVEQFRPGVMDRLGLGFDAVSKVKQDIVYCAITGYGQDGPKRDVAGHDLNYIGEAGLLSLGHGPSSRPVVPPALIADIAGGAYPAIVNILLALRERDRSGQACFIDVAMTDGVLPFTYWAMGQGMVGGQWPGNGNGLVTGGSPRYRLYPTSDGQLLAAAPLEDKFWRAFVELIELPEPLRDDRVDPQATIAAVASRVGAKSAAYWLPRIEAADCCCSIVKDVQQAMQDAHFRARGWFEHRLANQAGEEVTALPIPLAPGLRRKPSGAVSAPALGADNDVLDVND